MIAATVLIFNTLDLLSSLIYSYMFTIRTIVNFKIAQRLIQEVTEILRKTQIASVLNSLLGLVLVLGVMLFPLRSGSRTDPNIQSHLRENLLVVLLCAALKSVDCYFYMVYNSFNYLRLSALMQLMSLVGTTAMAYFLAITCQMGLGGILLSMVLDGIVRTILIQGYWYWTLNLPKEICAVEFS